LAPILVIGDMLVETNDILAPTLCRSKRQSLESVVGGRIRSDRTFHLPPLETVAEVVPDTVTS
jgi:hypothetical protein